MEIDWILLAINILASIGFGIHESKQIQKDIRKAGFYGSIIPVIALVFFGISSFRKPEFLTLLIEKISPVIFELIAGAISAAIAASITNALKQYSRVNP